MARHPGTSRNGKPLSLLNLKKLGSRVRQDSYWNPGTAGTGKDGLPYRNFLGRDTVLCRNELLQ